MPSKVWNRTPEEAFENPFEYKVQEQFAREAKELLKALNKRFQEYSMKFHRDNRSVEKAIWMLQLDALVSLQDASNALSSKKHRIAAKLFRDVVETLDLAAYFHSRTEESLRKLEKWYGNEVIPNRVYRDYIKKIEGEDVSEEKKKRYNILSKYTHRTYNSLLDGYVLGKGELIYHDSYVDSDMLVLPQTIASYFPGLATLILEFVSEVMKCGLFPPPEILGLVKESLDTETIPYRFEQRSTQ